MFNSTRNFFRNVLGRSVRRSNALHKFTYGTTGTAAHATTHPAADAHASDAHVFMFVISLRNDPALLVILAWDIY